ncbi:MAG: HD domain-containing protein [Candidatus Omnitrophica bacterium]|nr:HD domain-containing protein [Candidatus Omnitrophota bacterium]
MAHKYIKDFKEGECVESVYLVREKSFDTTRSGAPYIAVKLADKTGAVNARKWDATKDLFDSFSVDEYIKIKGKVEIYRKYPQVKLDALQKVKDSAVDRAVYVPAVEKDRDEMFRSFLSELGQVKNTHLKQLLKNIFANADCTARFKMAPAATDFHHPYLGGLLEHTLSCMQLARIVASRYPDIDIDLLICGTALHDIGKIEELSYEKSFYYTDKGRLIGHIVLGTNLVEKEITGISGFPDELKSLLLHIMLSHHGEQEWGSPKRPMCLEAIVLHHVDNLDAKINGFGQFVKTCSDPYSNWTKHSKMFREFLYKKQISKNKEKEVGDGEEEKEEDS